MQLVPFQNQPERSSRESSLDHAVVNPHRSIVFTISGMKVRRRMVTIVNGDDDTEESAYLWQLSLYLQLYSA